MVCEADSAVLRGAVGYRCRNDKGTGWRRGYGSGQSNGGAGGPAGREPRWHAWKAPSVSRSSSGRSAGSGIRCARYNLSSGGDAIDVQFGDDGDRDGLRGSLCSGRGGIRRCCRETIRAGRRRGYCSRESDGGPAGSRWAKATTADSQGSKRKSGFLRTRCR